MPYSNVITFILEYRKIPKISPSMYKPHTRNAKNPSLNRPSKYKPPGGLYLEIPLKYKVKQSKNRKFPTIRLPYSYLISRSLNFVIFVISMGENDKRSLNFAKALSTSFYFQKKILNYNLSKQT